MQKQARLGQAGERLIRVRIRFPLDSGVFQQKVYPGSTCDESKVPPMEQTYSKNTCLYGYKLGNCYEGACFDETSSSEEEESVTA